MPRVVEIMPSHTPAELRRLAALGKDANQSRRLLSIAAVLEGMSRADAARIGGMDRQTLRDWAHRFNIYGPAGLKDNRRRGSPRRLSVPICNTLESFWAPPADRTFHPRVPLLEAVITCQRGREVAENALLRGALGGEIVSVMGGASRLGRLQFGTVA